MLIENTSNIIKHKTRLTKIKSHKLKINCDQYYSRNNRSNKNDINDNINNQ